MDYPSVIVRGFQGKPMMALALASTEARVMVVNPQSLNRVQTGETAPLFIPRHDVFDFDADIYQRLAEEWRECGKTNDQTWSALRPWAGRVYA